MKEIMKEWREYLNEANPAIRAYVAGLGRKSGQELAGQSVRGAGFLVAKLDGVIPGLQKVIQELSILLRQNYISQESITKGLEKIADFFLSIIGEKAMASQVMQNLVLRFWLFLKNNLPIALKIFPKLARGVPLISIIIDTIEIYNKMKIVFEEIERANTYASRQHAERMRAFLLIRDYDELIKQRGYPHALGELNKKIVNDLKNAFNSAKMMFPNIIEFNKNVYQLITDYEKGDPTGALPLPEN